MSYKDKIVDFFKNYKYKKIAFEQSGEIAGLKSEVERLENIINGLIATEAPYQKQVGHGSPVTGPFKQVSGFEEVPTSVAERNAFADAVICDELIWKDNRDQQFLKRS